MGATSEWRMKLLERIAAGDPVAALKYERWRKSRNEAISKYRKSLRMKAAAGDPVAAAKHAVRVERERLRRKRKAEAKRLAKAVVGVV